MQEHENTITKLRQYFLAKLFEHVREAQRQGAHYTDDFDYIAMLDQCTTLQLHAICAHFLDHQAPIILNHCKPNDHLSLMLGNIYVGIEPDGYTHS